MLLFLIKIIFRKLQISPQNYSSYFLSFVFKTINSPKLMDESVGKSNIGVYVQNMLQQVSSSVEHLLDNLSFIYQSHGINFSIKQNHSVLMRMLAPFELLSQFKVDDNSDIVGNMFYAKCRQSSNCHSERFKTLRD